MSSTVRSLSVCLSLLAPAVAQGDYAFARLTPGTIGQALTFTWSGAPASKSLVQMLSANAGPTPLSLLSPGDPRSLQVGLDLVTLWTAVGSGASGSGAWALPVPGNPALHGLALHFQTCTFPGTTFLVDRIGSRCVGQLGLANTAAALAAALPGARALMSTFVRAGTVDVVVAGGGTGSVLGGVGLKTSDLWATTTLEARVGPALTIARSLHTTTPLPDGRVLLAGGVDAQGLATATAELYDPVANTFAATGTMSLPRGAHAAALLPDGRVLVVGGTTTFADAIQALANAQSSAEIWSPATGTWSQAANMGVRRLAPGLDTLPNGKVLMSGGFEIVSVLGLPVPVGAVSTCRLYTPATNAWSSGASMTTARATHGLSTLLLKDGRLLVTGGATSGPDLTQAAAIAQAETYDAGANAWTPLASMAQPRATHTATQLADGRVFVCGGARGTLSAPISLDLVQVFQPASSSWTPPLPPLTTTRAAHGAVVTPDGLLVLLGGNGGPQNTSLKSVETIHP